MKILTLFFLLFPFTSYCQNLIPSVNNGLWGLTADGESDIEYSYQFITPISKYQVYKVGQNQKIGLLNIKGEEILPCQYDRIEVINQNLYVVWNEKGASLINSGQNILTKNSYKHIQPFGQFLKTIKDNKEGIITLKGLELIPPRYDYIELAKENPIFIVENENNKSFLNLEGVEQIALEYKAIEVIAHHQLLLTLPNSPTVIFVLLDENGNLKSKKQFNKYADFENFQKRFYLSFLKKELKQSNVSSPQWIEIMGDHYLISPEGTELLEGLSFFYVQKSDKEPLSIARREERDGTLYYYLINHEIGKVLFKDSFKDIVFADFNESQWARISVDTLWDCLINKEGDVKRTIQSDGNDYPFLTVGNFYEGHAFYHTKNNLFGFINTDAKSVIPPTYTLASDFKEGVSIVKKNGLYGAINLQGQIIIPIQYDGISLCENGWFRTKKGTGTLGKWGIINKENKVILDFKYQEIILDDKGANVKIQGKWGRYLRSGKWAFVPKIKVSKLYSFKNGIGKMERGAIYDPIDRKTLIGYKYQGYIKEDGTVIIPPIYQEIIGFQRAWEKQEGLAILKKKGLIGYVNYKGSVLLEPIYQSANAFAEVWTIHKGIAKVVNAEGKVSFVDSNGKEVLPFEYDGVNNLYQKIWSDSTGVTVASFEGKNGLINYKGERKSPFVYEKLIPINDSIFVGQTKNKWGIINADGDTVVNFSYSNALPLSSSYIQLIQDTTLNLSINDSGKWSTSIPQVASKLTPSFTKEEDYIYHFIENDYAIIAKKGKSKLQGVVDRNNKIIIKPSFKKILPYQEDLAVAQKEGKSAKDRKYGFIDVKGKWVINASFNNASSFHTGLAAVCINNKWGYINKENQKIIPLQFNSASDFVNNIAVVNGNTLLSNTGNILGTLPKNEIIKKVTDSHIISKGIGYEHHLSHNGVVLYDKKFDEVTAFNSSGIAFVKTGEKWLLKRKINDTEVTKTFTKEEKEIYLLKYGNHRKVVSLTGDVSQDIGFEKIDDGTWRMISLDGYPINNIIFSNVKVLENGNFNFQIKQVGKIVNSKGDFATEKFIQSVQLFDNGIITFSNGNSLFISE